MFGFDKVFDFNRDGKLDSVERAMQFQFLDEMSREENHDSGNSWDDEDESDIFADAGLDPDEFDF